MIYTCLLGLAYIHVYLYRLHDGHPLAAWPWLSVLLPSLLLITGCALGELVLNPSQIALLWITGCLCAALACWSSALALSFTIGVLLVWGISGHSNEWSSLIQGYRLLLLVVLGPAIVTALIGVLKVWRPSTLAWVSIGLLLNYPEVVVVENLPPQGTVNDPYLPSFLWLTASVSLAASCRVLLNWVG